MGSQKQSRTPIRVLSEGPQISCLNLRLNNVGGGLGSAFATDREAPKHRERGTVVHLNCACPGPHVGHAERPSTAPSRLIYKELPRYEEALSMGQTRASS